MKVKAINQTVLDSVRGSVWVWVRERNKEV